MQLCECSCVGCAAVVAVWLCQAVLAVWLGWLCIYAMPAMWHTRTCSQFFFFVEWTGIYFLWESLVRLTINRINKAYHTHVALPGYVALREYAEQL
jgi:hypothetical protein